MKVLSSLKSILRGISVLLSLVSKNSKTLNRELTHSLAGLFAKLDKYDSGKLPPTPTLMQHFTLSEKLVLTFGYGGGRLEVS